MVLYMCAVQDENDEEPIFSSSSYNHTIDEDIRSGSTVLRVTASDADTSPNAMLQYSLVSIAGEAEGTGHCIR